MTAQEMAFFNVLTLFCRYFAAILTNFVRFGTFFSPIFSLYLAYI